MGKTVLPSKNTEWKGLDRISEVVHAMNCIWRETSKDDFGLDGEIEMVVQKADGKGLETNGQIVKVQSKAGERYVVSDTASTFASPVELTDLEYWQSCNVPVLYIVYHPKDDLLYFKEVKKFIKATPNVFARPYRILFDKAKDVFGAGAKAAVTQYADTSPPRIDHSQKERLFTNLLPIARLPTTIYRAKTRKRSWQAIKDENSKQIPPGHERPRSLPPACIVDGVICSLTDPMHDMGVLKQWCTKAEQPVSIQEWIENEERVGDVIFLFNQLLGKHFGRCGIRYNPEFKRNYFPRENETAKVFTRKWTSARTHVADERIVVKWYEYGKDCFWRHLAVETSFRKFGEDWFLQIHPKYFFTTDGEMPCDGELVGPYSTSLKADEHNSQVLNHILFWSDILSFGTDKIRLKLFGESLMEIEKLPLHLIAPFAIPNDPATYQEKSPVEQKTLFDWTGEDGDD